jgi:hypothetical protein
MNTRQRLATNLDLLEKNAEAVLRHVQETRALLFDCPSCRDEGRPGDGCRVCGLRPGEHPGYGGDDPKSERFLGDS